MTNTTDMLSIVLMVRATYSLRIEQHMGRAVQQFVLAIMQDASPALSASLHEGNHEAKAYTVSGLLAPDSLDPLHGDVQQGDRAWLRLCGLQCGVAEVLAAFAAQPPSTVEINRVPWELERVLVADHRWAGGSSYQALLQQATKQPPRDQLRLEFATPTGFHSKGVNVPVPLPTLVFGSLVKRWNAFAPFPLPELLEAYIEQNVVIHRYWAETQLLMFKQGSKQIGFVGDVTYNILASNPSLAKIDPALAEALAANTDNFARAVNMLAAYAFYSGVGIKTTTGMGLVREINISG